MKTIGGTIGVGNSAHFRGASQIFFGGPITRTYDSTQIVAVHANQNKVKKFGFTGFILGSILFGALLAYFFALIGVLVAVVISAIGSFYSKTNYIVTITFSDQNSATLECSKHEMSKLISLKK